PESTSIQAATLIFIAIQGLGAYFFAGVHKLLEPRWRSGVLLKNIYYQSSFAVPWLTRQSWMSHINWKIASLTIIIIELSAGSILTLPRPFVWSFLSIALLFHIWNVLTWGLNHFLLTFSASFPAILWCYEWLHIN
ncbi:MAG: hypothetical protein KDD62_08155, partial [Bdellovibrionales bacterium]|nr:hypothetical protein [Bdellovibrionales bacterium]